MATENITDFTTKHYHDASSTAVRATVCQFEQRYVKNNGTPQAIQFAYRTAGWVSRVVTTVREWSTVRNRRIFPDLSTKLLGKQR